MMALTNAEKQARWRKLDAIAHPTTLGPGVQPLTEQIIPRREPGLVEAEAKRRWHGDPEKVATTTLTSLMIRGVELTSRYSKAHEYVVMQRAVLKLSSGLAGAVVSIFCDSKATCVYEVVVRNWDDNGDLAHQLGKELDSILLRLDGGHNGIWIKPPASDRDALVLFNPHWACDDDLL
jgi:hypothetical protein